MKPTKSYTQLRTTIQNTLSEGHLRAQRAVERERVATYWTVGDHLVRFLDANPAEYGAQVMKQLATDLSIRERLLYEIAQLRRMVPKLPSKAILSWSHYRKLLGVKESAVRNTLLSEAEKMRWTVAALTEAITAEGQGARVPRGKIKNNEPSSLAAKRGEPYLYKLIDKPHIGLVLDQGFRTYTIPPPSLPTFAKPGDVFRSVKTRSSYRLEPYEKVRRVWSYSAHITRVIDGDTMWVTLDTGFGDYVDQKLRLRGIDTAELGTEDGQRAKDFVSQAVGTTNPILVATTKVDKYDRYLADVLYSPEGAAEIKDIVTNGIYLNRQLITEGLAERYTK